MEIPATPIQQNDHLKKHLRGIKAAAIRWLNRPPTRVTSTEAVRHLAGLATEALEPMPPTQVPDHRDLEGQPEVEELDPEETQDPVTHVYEIETGVTYWVIAHDPPEALQILGASGWIDCWDDDCGPATGAMTVEVPSLERLNHLCFYDEHADEPERRRMAAEYNLDPSPRVMACSEY